MRSALVLASLFALSAPDHLHVARYKPHVVLVWAHDGQHVSGFEVERAVAGRSFTRIGTAGREARTFRDLTSRPGMTYVYRIRAVGTGVSPYSNEVIVKITVTR